MASSNQIMNNMQQQFNLMQMMMPQAQMNNQSILQSDQFPDILQHLSTDHAKALFEVLAESNNPNLVNKQGSLGGYTPLHWMCIKNEIEMIEFLITKCKADINAKATQGETPLFVCIKNCNIYTIELLIKYGADMNARDMYNRSIMHWSAYTGKVLLFYYFQKYHNISNLNDVDQFQQNPLHIACASGFAELIKYLLDTGEVNIYAQDCNGNTCLHMAAKCGLPRLCWLITQKDRGEGARLIGVLNIQNQRPFDVIRNEKAPHFKKIKDWLRLEAKTNEYLLDSCQDASSFEKKTDHSYSSNASLLKIKRGTRFFKWTSKRSMQLEYLIRFISFGTVLTVPMLIYWYLFDNQLNAWKGFFGYSTFIGIIFVITKQRHRIEHISGLQNPYHIGFFSSLFIYNYWTHYVYLMESFNIIRPFDFITTMFTVLHGHAFYRIMTANPGFAKENIKKPDGTPFDLRDLMKTNAKEASKSTKDSISWLTNPSTSNKSQQNALQPYFCESCLLIQTLPTKHCKLCEGCCLKFDHHCLFINKCVGLKNHRPFMIFLLTSLASTLTFLYEVLLALLDSTEEVQLLNLGKQYQDQMTLVYFFFASRYHIWLLTLFLIDGFAILMVVFLFLFQLRFISLGFTSQFPPPSYFVKSNKNMSTFISAVKHRLANLYVFCFGSFDDNHELYFRQTRDYYASIGNQAIPLLYPRNNFNDGFNDFNETQANNKQIPNPLNVSSNASNNSNGFKANNNSSLNSAMKHHEIDLD